MQKTVINAFVIILSLCSTTNAMSQDLLQQCWQKQVGDTLLTLNYEEDLNELHHSFEPWQQTPYKGIGTIWTDGTDYAKSDSLQSPRRTYTSSTQFNNSQLLFQDYGDDELFPVTKIMEQEHAIAAARYTPSPLLSHFVKEQVQESASQNPIFAVYQTNIGNSVVSLTIRKADHLLHQVTVLADDELFGDVRTVITYMDHKTIGTLSIPTKMRIAKINGKVVDKVRVKEIEVAESIPTLLTRPEGYKLAETKKPVPEVRVEKKTDNIYFIELLHTDDRVLLVEFEDFFLVAEAPINSSNGELIIAEAKKINPTKPIKYFVYGHYHQHYIGGIRPFVHAGAKIICSEKNRAYMEYIVNAPRTLNPDKLQKEPKSLQTLEITDSLTIADSNFEMEIYFIGGRSAHTIDYLIYYFPSEKLLFQDDLIWIAKEGPLKKAGKRQAGLYGAITELGLDVDTIVQSWPVKNRKVKTRVSFDELKRSVEMQ